MTEKELLAQRIREIREKKNKKKRKSKGGEKNDRGTAERIPKPKSD